MTKYTPGRRLPYAESPDYLNDFPDVVSKVLAERVDAAITDTQFYRGAQPLLPGANIEALESGIYTVWNASLAGELGLPEPFQGSIEVHRWGATGGIARYNVDEDPPRVWQANRNPDGWSEWVRIDAGAVPPPPQSTGGSGMKIVPLALTRGNNGSSTAPTTGAVRIPIRYNAPILRWRLHMVDGNPRLNDRRPTTIDLTAIWLGDDAGNGQLTNWQWLYNVDKTAGTGTADLVTPWSTTPIGDDAARMLSFGYTASAPPVDLVGGCYRSDDPAGGHPNSTATFTRSTTCPFDIWLEVETYSTTPVVAAYGSSSSIGVGADFPILDAPLAQYMRQHGGLPVLYGHSGDALLNFADPAQEKLNRWTHLARPDAVIDALGSNDIFAYGVSLGEYQALHAAAMEAVAATISPTIYGTTVPPRTSDTSSAETVRRSINTWLIAQPNGIRDVFDFAGAVSADDETIRPEFDADGIHCNAAGYAAMSAAITTPVTSPMPS